MTERSSSWRGLFAAAREYVTLENAAEALGRMSGPVRATVAKQLAEAWQKRDAAELLLSRGSAAEALRVGLESAARLRCAFDEIDSVASVREGRLPKALDGVERAARELGSVPSLDREVTPAHRSALEDLLRSEYALERLSGTFSLDASALVYLRWTNRLRVVLAFVVAIALVAMAATAVLSTRVQASGKLGALYAPDRALDGSRDTDWVADDHAEPWIELRLWRSRSIRRIALVNGHVLPDRAAKTIRIDLYDGDRVIASLSHTFEADRGATASLDAAGVRCNRVRVTVTSVYGAGAALSEIAVE